MEKLLRRLVSFQTDKNHPTEIKDCFDFIVADLKKAGLKVKTFLINKKPSLVASTKQKKHYQFILNGHLDVVPADYKNAFKLKIKNGRFYGRGTADMKGPLAALIELAKYFAINKPQTDFALMITSDEEIGGKNGVRYLLDKEKYFCDCAIIPDGGRNFHLTLAEKGVLHIKFEAKGKAAHGSQPWLGDNALDKLIKIYNNIKKLTIFKKRRLDNWNPTINLGVLQGGNATNKVPDYALMQIDFRFPDKKDKAKIIALINKEIKKEKVINWSILAQGAPLINDKQNFYFKKIKKVAQKFNIRLKNKKEHGASDGRFFSEKNIPVIAFKPICSPSHIDNEWIDIKTLKIFFEILKQFILEN